MSGRGRAVPGSATAGGSGPTREDLAAAFVALHEHLRVGGPAPAGQRLVELAASTVPGCDWVAITLWPQKGKPRAWASTGAVAPVVDTIAHDLDEGPCLDAAVSEDPVSVEDVATERRWPGFAAALCAESPVRSILTFRLGHAPDRSALNLYGGRPHAFDRDAVTLAASFAAHARVLMLHSASVDRAANLALALVSSRQIGVAIGILMNINKITSEQAFELLREVSQRLHRKLRDVAEDVTRTGVLPGR